LNFGIKNPHGANARRGVNYESVSDRSGRAVSTPNSPVAFRSAPLGLIGCPGLSWRDLDHHTTFRFVKTGALERVFCNSTVIIFAIVSLSLPRGLPQGLILTLTFRFPPAVVPTLPARMRLVPVCVLSAPSPRDSMCLFVDRFGELIGSEERCSSEYLDYSNIFHKCKTFDRLLTFFGRNF